MTASAAAPNGLGGGDGTGPFAVAGLKYTLWKTANHARTERRVCAGIWSGRLYPIANHVLFVRREFGIVVAAVEHLHQRAGRGADRTGRQVGPQAITTI